MKFRFHLNPPLNNPSKSPKTIFVEANDLQEARTKVEHLFPDWPVSMFWPLAILDTPITLPAKNDYDTIRDIYRDAYNLK